MHAIGEAEDEHVAVVAAEGMRARAQREPLAEEADGHVVAAAATCCHPSLLMCCACAGALDMFHETRMCENDCKWLAHRWTISAKGNPYRHVADYHIVVFASDGEWGGLISNAETFFFTKPLEETIFLDNKYPAADAAKLALLALLRRMTHGAVDDIFEPEERVDEVAKWLKSFLADGPKLRKELLTAAQSKDYSTVMIMRGWQKTQSSAQRVEWSRGGDDPDWTMRLPEPKQDKRRKRK